MSEQKHRSVALTLLGLAALLGAGLLALRLCGVTDGGSGALEPAPPPGQPPEPAPSLTGRQGEPGTQDRPEAAQPASGPAIVLRGVVEDEWGKRLQSGHVQVAASSSPFTTVSLGEHGEFRWPWAHEFGDRVTVQYLHTGNHHSFPVQVNRTGANDEVLLVSWRPVRVVCHVTDPAALPRPYAQARLSLGGQAASDSDSATRWQEADEAGTVEFLAMPGLVAVEAVDRNGAMGLSQAVPAAPGELLDVTVVCGTETMKVEVVIEGVADGIGASGPQGGPVTVLIEADAPLVVLQMSPGVDSHVTHLKPDAPLHVRLVSNRRTLLERSWPSVREAAPDGRLALSLPESPGRCIVALRHEDGTPLPGVVVRLARIEDREESPSDHQEQRATDYEGVSALDVAPGVYAVSALPATRPPVVIGERVELSSSQTRRIDVVLNGYEIVEGAVSGYEAIADAAPHATVDLSSPALRGVYRSAIVGGRFRFALPIEQGIPVTLVPAVWRRAVGPAVDARVGDRRVLVRFGDSVGFRLCVSLGDRSHLLGCITLKNLESGAVQARVGLRPDGRGCIWLPNLDPGRYEIELSTDPFGEHPIASSAEPLVVRAGMTHAVATLEALE